jgi:2-C-methyl-D-erythritol 4-phosphate cytidylyltransferase
MSSSADKSTPGFWAVVPAAGQGARMGAALPKQYLALAGRTVLEHTLARLATEPRIQTIVVAVAPDDAQWETLGHAFATPVHAVPGGAERCHSVLNALEYLVSEAHPDDWVLVHDAARPCLRATDLTGLMDSLSDHPVGGLLGLPVSDTLKRCRENGEVIETVDRGGLWRALTPQMFRLGMLRDALRDALAAGVLVTDEAGAMERAGLAPRIVHGHADNIKITHPQDLALAALYLREQENDACA